MEDEEPFGQQIWGIGYISSDWLEERDDEYYNDDEDELYAEHEILMKIRSGQQLKPSEMDTVSYSSQLRDVYNYRWWNTEL